MSDLEETISRSPILRQLRFLSEVWLGRLREANGRVPEHVYLPLMAMTSDVRYLEMIGEQREATRLRWRARKAFAEHRLTWVKP